MEAMIVCPCGSVHGPIRIAGLLTIRNVLSMAGRVRKTSRIVASSSSSKP